MFRLLILIVALSLLAICFACTGATGSHSPTEAYKQLYAAVKSKDIEAVKKHLTKKTIEFGAMAAARNNTQPEKIYENGFTSTTFSSELPTIRDERIKENMGAIEVWNSEKNIWEDLPFINEDGAWKLAIGELFSGSFTSPGKGRDEREKEAANVMADPVAPASNTNGNTRTPAVTDVPLDPSRKKK
jgi:hypothetical protein